MSHKLIIISIITLLAISFVTLAFIEKQAKDPNLNKDWWALYFQDPHGSDLDFTIENHSDTTHFTYTVTLDNRIAQQKSVDIPKGETKNISIDFDAQENQETTITARTTQEDTKRIYK